MEAFTVRVQLVLSFTMNSSAEISMNALVTWTNATHRQPTAEIFKEGTSAAAKQATNTYKAMNSIANLFLALHWWNHKEQP